MLPRTFRLCCRSGFRIIGAGEYDPVHVCMIRVERLKARRTWTHAEIKDNSIFKGAAKHDRKTENSALRLSSTCFPDGAWRKLLGPQECDSTQCLNGTQTSAPAFAPSSRSGMRESITWRVKNSEIRK